MHAFRIPAELAGLRLDQALARLLPDYSRSRLKHWIEAGRVRVQNRTPKPRDLLAGGEQVVVEAETSFPQTVSPEAIDLDIVHADDWLIVVNKPAGLVVHPGSGNREHTLQNALLHYDAALATLPRAGIVHRLDQGTSGLLVIARTPMAHTALIRQLQARAIEREYQAICAGVLTAGGTIDRAIGRHRIDRVRMAVRADGRAAVTHYRVLERFRGHTLVRVNLETGRTHQIRVHFAHIRHPLVGDSTYGRRLLLPRGATPSLVAALQAFRRQALHASRLKLVHPHLEREVEWHTALPPDMKALVKVLREDARARQTERA